MYIRHLNIIRAIVDNINNRVFRDYSAKIVCINSFDDTFYMYKITWSDNNYIFVQLQYCNPLELFEIMCFCDYDTCVSHETYMTTYSQDRVNNDEFINDVTGEIITIK